MIKRTDPMIFVRAVRYQQRARGNAAARRALGTGGYDEQHHQDI